MEKNPVALQSAFLDVLAKRKKCVQLGVADISLEQTDALVLDLATAKAIDEGVTIQEVIKGQQWYVDSLKRFVRLTPKQQLEECYAHKLSLLAEEDEMLEYLESLD